jgi:hypothetical protein
VERQTLIHNGENMQKYIAYIIWTLSLLNPGLFKARAKAGFRLVGEAVKWVIGRGIGLFQVKGLYHFECYDKHGNLKWREVISNGVTDGGINSILDIMFHGTTQITTWYLGLIDNAGFTAVAPTDTMASHAGWDEFTDYDEANRVTWAEGAAASKSITNATPAEFTINDTGTIKGVFLTSENTKGGTTGGLWGTAVFSATRNVENEDVLRVTYTITGAAA